MITYATVKILLFLVVVVNVDAASILEQMETQSFVASGAITSTGKSATDISWVPSFIPIPVTGTFPALLGEMTSLTKFNMWKNEDVYGTVPSEFGFLVKLKFFVIDTSSKVTGRIPTSLSSLTALTYFAFVYTSVSKTIPDIFINWKQASLGVLLYYNKLSGPIPNTLEQMSNISNLQLHQNPLLCISGAAFTCNSPCVYPSCPAAVDGRWAAWTTCSNSCSGGTQTRTCTQPAPANGGADCSGLDGGLTTQNCNTQACPLDGNWSTWSSCSVQCGTGQQTRSCSNPLPVGTGADCSGLDGGMNQRQCNTHVCGINEVCNPLCEVSKLCVMNNCVPDPNYIAPPTPVTPAPTVLQSGDAGSNVTLIISVASIFSVIIIVLVSVLKKTKSSTIDLFDDGRKSSTLHASTSDIDMGGTARRLSQGVRRLSQSARRLSKGLGLGTTAGGIDVYNEKRRASLANANNANYGNSKENPDSDDEAVDRELRRQAKQMRKQQSLELRNLENVIRRSGGGHQRGASGASQDSLDDC